MGNEQAKTRPCVLISTDLTNDYSTTVTVAPLSTAKKKPFVFHVSHKESLIKVEQLHTVDKKRLVSFKESVSSLTLSQIKETLVLYFGL